MQYLGQFVVNRIQAIMSTRNILVMLLCCICCLQLGCFEESSNSAGEDNTSTNTDDSATDLASEREVEFISEAGYTLKARLVTKSDRSSTGNISTTSPGVIIVTLVDEKSQGIPNLLIEFSSEDTTFSPVKGKAVTNEKGQAEITVLDKNETGTASILIKAKYKADELSLTLNLEIIPPKIKMGSGSGLSFQDGILSVGVTPISAGGTAVITATFVDEALAFYSSGVDVSFTSDCVKSSLSTIDALVASVNGSASATYKAAGCEGRDVITATANIGGTTFTALAIIVIQSDTVGSIEFVSAAPNTIALQGAGTALLSETSKVTFKVKGGQGLALSNQTVAFRLTSQVGGVTLSPVSAVTDSSGLASAVVRSGYIAQSVSVVASVSVMGSTTIQTQSSSLVITTGTPDQNSVSLTSSQHNPEGWSYDATTISSVIRLADVFNNPAPDGTAVNFTTEGGAIGGACNTTVGTCSVTWYSQNPRPENGRVTILATAVGHESFADVNGNGVFDNGDTFEDLGEAFLDVDYDGRRDAAETCTDSNANGVWDDAEYYYDDNASGAYTLGEPFIDKNANGSWTAAEPIPVGNDLDSDGRCDVSEPYIDFDEDGVYDLPNALYNGILCQDTVRCDTGVSQVTVRDNNQIVMSGSSAYIWIKFNGTWFAPGTFFTANVTLSSLFTILIMDENGNSLPGASVITLENDNGELSGDTSFTINNSISARIISTLITSDGTSDSGVLSIKIKTPKDNESARSISIQD